MELFSGSAVDQALWSKQRQLVRNGEAGKEPISNGRTRRTPAAILAEVHERRCYRQHRMKLWSGSRGQNYCLSMVQVLRLSPIVMEPRALHHLPGR